MIHSLIEALFVALRFFRGIWLFPFPTTNLKSKSNGQFEIVVSDSSLDLVRLLENYDAKKTGLEVTLLSRNHYELCYYSTVVRRCSAPTSVKKMSHSK